MRRQVDLLDSIEIWALPQSACCVPLYLSPGSERSWTHVHGALPRVSLAIFYPAGASGPARAASS